MTKRTPPFSPEVRERAVRMFQDHKGEHSAYSDEAGRVFRFQAGHHSNVKAATVPI